MEDLKKFKLNELKNILKKLELPTSGKKDELISRIRKHKPSKVKVDLKTIPDVNFIPTDNITFQDFINTHFKDYTLSKVSTDGDPCLSKSDKKEAFSYFKYQKFLIDYMSIHNSYKFSYTKSKGLLVYHGLGSGKTCTALGMAESSRYYLKDGEPEFRKVILMIPASLKQSPWVKELTGTCGPKRLENGSLYDINKYGYYFVHYNGKPFNQLESFQQLNPFDNSVIIIDEVHNFVNALSRNNQSDRYKLYKMIMNSKNSRLIFLSGTPIMNTPIELSFIFNMLRGKVIFPEEYEEFNKIYFRNGKFINKQLFQSKINGLVSYYRGATDDVFARKEVKKVFVQMSEHQYDLHKKINSFEEGLSKTTVKDVDSTGTSSNSKLKDVSEIEFFKRQYITMKRAIALKVRGNLRSILGITTSGTNEADEGTELFKVFTISNSNFAYPSKLIEDYSKIKVPGIVKIKPSTLTEISKEYKFNLEDCSPKMLSIYKNIISSKGPDLVYSKFKGPYGLGIFSEILKQHGFEEYNTKTKKSVSSLLNENKYRFALWTGDTSEQDKIKILDMYNDPKNIKGKLIKAICITQAGKEGISLMNVRQVHIMEPWWNINVLKQIIGRAIRICSHAMLPKSERNVKVFNYLSVYKDVETPDIFVTKVAIRKNKLETEFINLLQETSLDCYLNYNHNNVNCKRLIKHISLDETVFDFSDTPGLKRIEIDNKKYFVIGNKIYEYLPKDKLSIGKMPKELGLIRFKLDGSVDKHVFF